MFRKYTAALFISVAYAILLGHSIIPHHHHDSEHEANEHHQTHHHHDSEDESLDLSHFLSHFVHSSDGFTLSVPHSFTESFTKKFTSLVAVLPVNFSLTDFDIPPLLLKPPEENLIYISPHSHLYGLRAPPAILI